MSLTTQVEHYAGSASGYSTVVSQALSDGVTDVVTKVIALRPDQAQYFSSMSVVTNRNGVTLDYSLPVLFVSRNTYPCLRGVFDIKDKYADPTSLVYATKYDPIYYIDKSGNDPKVMIKPDPSVLEPGYVTRVVIGTPNDNYGIVSHFPDNYVPLVVKYSAMRLLHAKETDVKEEIRLLEVDAKSASDSVSSQTNSISLIKADISTAIEGMSGFQDVFDEYLVNQAVYASSISGYVSEINSATSLFSSAVTSYNIDLATEMDQLSSSLSAYELDIDTLIGDIDTSSVVDELNDIRSHLVGFISSLGSAESVYSASVTTAFDEMTASVARLRLAVAEYTPRVDIVKSDVLGYVTEINAINNVVGTYVDNDEDIELAASKANQVNILTAKLNNKLSEKTLDDSKFESKMRTEADAIQAVMNGFGAKTKGAEYSLSSLTARVSAVIQSVSALSSQSATILGNVSAEKAFHDSEFAAKVKAIESRVQIIEQRFANVAAKTTTTISAIGAKTSSTISLSQLADASVASVMRNIEFIMAKISAYMKNAEIGMAVINGLAAGIQSINSQIAIKKESLAVMANQFSKISSEYSAFFDSLGGGAR